jgi:oxygen-independent coproporphyrinogen III oxidase
VCKEIRLRSQPGAPWSRAQVATLYLGGGTPSVLSLGQVEHILATVRDKFHLAPDPEITFEVNPGTVDDAYLAGLKQMGITRLSIGAQSFVPEKLSFLSRIHTRKQVFDTLAGADRAGFSNVGLDLIYGLPGETPDIWQKDLETALGFQMAHLSCYMLTIAPETPFFDLCEKGLLCPCDRDLRMDFFVQTVELLENRGYTHYEVSNFALGLKNQSMHNAHYWKRGAYLGMGPSAHSFLPSDAGARQGVQGSLQPAPGLFHLTPQVRSWNVADVTSWLAHLAFGRIPEAGKETLTPVQEALEQVMLGLRTKHGIQVKGLDSDIQRFMARLEEQGLGRVYLPEGQPEASRHFNLTRSGLTCLDNIVDAFAQKIFDKPHFYNDNA